MTDDYYEIEISDSVYRCPFCYNKDYSLSDLLRHASRIADNSRKTVKNIARHSVLITYIPRILTTLKEEIDVARTTEAFPTSVKPVEEHSVTEPVVSIVETDEHMVSLCDGENRNDEQPKEEQEEKETEEPEVIEVKAANNRIIQAQELKPLGQVKLGSENNNREERLEMMTHKLENAEIKSLN